MRKFLLPLTLLPIIHVARGDVIFPLTFVFIPYIPPVILIEVMVFLALRGKLRMDTRVARGAVVVAIANIISSTVGLVVPGPYKADILVWFLFAYILSTIVEGIAYRFGLGLNAWNGILLSATLNAVSYTVVFAAMFVKML